jgi:hypothetical protein
MAQAAAKMPLLLKIEWSAQKAAGLEDAQNTV